VKLRDVVTPAHDCVKEPIRCAAGTSMQVGVGH
jgi:hypothetical protein